MTCFSGIHNALQHSNVGKAMDQAKKHPKRVATAAKFAMMVA